MFDFLEKVSTPNETALLHVFLSCSIPGSNDFNVQYVNQVMDRTVITQPVFAYSYNTNFLIYGTSADTFLTATSAQNQCDVNISLGFNYTYATIPITTVSVCQQAFIGLNSNTSTSHRIAATTTTGLAVNSSWGSVSYRVIDDVSTLTYLTSLIVRYFYGNGSFNFMATGAFVATWNHVPYSSNYSLECNAQIILVTDGIFSYFIMNFGRIDLYTSSSFGDLTGSSFVGFTANSASSNVGLEGTYVYLVNGRGEEKTIRFVSLIMITLIFGIKVLLIRSFANRQLIMWVRKLNAT
jgi:hypothetical protein